MARHSCPGRREHPGGGCALPVVEEPAQARHYPPGEHHLEADVSTLEPWSPGWPDEVFMYLSYPALELCLQAWLDAPLEHDLDRSRSRARQSLFLPAPLVPAPPAATKRVAARPEQQHRSSAEDVKEV